MKRLMLGLVVASALSFGMLPGIQQAEAKSFGEIVDSALNAISPNRYNYNYGNWGYGNAGVNPYYVNYSNQYTPYYGGYSSYVNPYVSPYVNPYVNTSPYYTNTNTGSSWTNLLRYLF
jgi:hypothetical protein